MKRKQLLKTGLSVLLASAMMFTSVPATSQAAEVEPLAGSTPILDSALVNYDFAQYQANADGNLANGDTVITLEGSGTKPALTQDERRGQVLSFTSQQYENRADALLPANPFAGKPVDNGFTLNFWTKTTGTAGGDRCLVDFEVAPATSGRAGTFAVNQKMVYWNTTDQDGKFTDFKIDNVGLDQQVWKMVTVAVTKTGITFYSDGKKVAHEISSGAEEYELMIKDLAGTSGIAKPEETNVRLGASLATYWHCPAALLDDVSFYGKALSDDEVAQLYKETAVEAPLESVAITGNQTVDEDKTIQLKVELTPADTTDDKTVTWKSSDESILTVDENGKVFGVKGGKANVTATVAGKVSAPFEITVNAVDFTQSLEPGYYLTVYSTTKAFYASAGNLSQETQSVYMAVSKDGQTFDVLNNNGGVIFAKEGSKQITAPKVVKSGESFLVVAPDSTASKGYHKFTSADGVHYYTETLEASAAEYNNVVPLKKSKFPLMYKGQNILTTDDTITLGNALQLTEEEYTYIVNKLGTVINTGFEPLADVTVGAADNVSDILNEKCPTVKATYSDGSTQEFKVDWGNSAADVDLTKPGTYTIKGEVLQTKYLNNLKKINGSTLPEDDPENDSATELDNYDEATGHVYYDNTKFVEGMADPNIFYDEKTDYYYMTGSYFPEESDKDRLPGDKTEQYDRVVLRKGKTLEDLQDRSKQVTLWKVGNQGFEDSAGKEVAKGARYIWAPEIHRVGDYWVVYFTESHGSLFDIYCHALVLDGNKDPYETALKAADGQSEWKDYQMRGGTGAETGAITKSFCLDMTYFEDDTTGQPYVIWAAKPHGNSDLFLAKVDKTQPWVLNSDILRLTTPEYGWENVRYMVNEGPTVLQKNGKIFMCYSASGTGSEYAIGMMTAEQGADLLDIKNWTKSPYPLLTSRDVEGEEGPGHNSFTVDRDGNDIFVYHARPTSHNYKHCGWDGEKSLHYNSEPLNDPCRHARLKRVHWAADGTPILKMTYEEELTAENQTVSVNVVVPSIGLDKKTLGIEAGKTATLKATGVSADEEVKWNTSNPKVATVKNGKVTAKKAGTAKITATANGKTATCTVTVVSLNATKLTLGVKENYTLKVSGTKKKVTWGTSDKKTASVKNGKVTAVKANKKAVTITAKVEGVTLKCTVTVKAAPGKLILKSKKNVTVKKNKTSQIRVNLPKNTAGALKYKSSKPKVVFVDANGKIKGKKKGSAKVTVTAVNNKKANVTVNVTVK